MKDGKVRYVHNWVGVERYTIASDKPAPAAKARIRFEFAYDGGGIGRGGRGTLFVNGKKVGEGRIEKTVPLLITDESADVGRDAATPVTEEYKERDNAFNGRIHKVTSEVK